MNLTERLNLVTDWVNKPFLDDWQSLVINRRKPETYRMFRFLPDGSRVCLHRFSHCDEDDAFPHPHAWPMEVLVLSGYYQHKLYRAPDSERAPSFEYPVSVHLHGPGSYYRLGDPLTFHAVTPKTDYVYTIMFNGGPFKYGAHAHVKTTKGKDLDSMSREEMGAHISMFEVLLHTMKEQIKDIGAYARG